MEGGSRFYYQGLKYFCSGGIHSYQYPVFLRSYRFDPFSSPPFAQIIPRRREGYKQKAYCDNLEKPKGGVMKKWIIPHL